MDRLLIQYQRFGLSKGWGGRLVGGNQEKAALEVSINHFNTVAMATRCTLHDNVCALDVEKEINPTVQVF